MKNATSFDRRSFLKTAGAGFISALGLRSRDALASTQMVFASAFKSQDGAYGIMLFNERYDEIVRFALPDRGHDIAFDPAGTRGVAFARRPGNFAFAFDPGNSRQPVMFTSPPNRHFYGHGVFSRDGKLLYTAENNFEDAVGIIGVYDATDRFTRIGEMPSRGTGPHQISFHPEKEILIVANGGIETHPDFGRAKLNIPVMKPSLVFLDAGTGQLIEKHQLPPELHKLSIRHMDVTGRGRVVFGCQFEGSKSDHPNLVGECSLGEAISLWKTDQADLNEFSNYAGSVAINERENLVAVTMPKGNRVACFHLQTGKLLKTYRQRESFGIARTASSFLTTSVQGEVSYLAGGETGNFRGLAFDNHLAGLN
jgi:hypothetical protein